jgi:hypothetical protein
VRPSVREPAAMLAAPQRTLARAWPAMQAFMWIRVCHPDPKAKLALQAAQRAADKRAPHLATQPAAHSQVTASRSAMQMESIAHANVIADSTPIASVYRQWSYAFLPASHHLRAAGQDLNADRVEGARSSAGTPRSAPVVRALRACLRARVTAHAGMGCAATPISCASGSVATPTAIRVRHTARARALTRTPIRAAVCMTNARPTRIASRAPASMAAAPTVLVAACPRLVHESCDHQVMSMKTQQYCSRRSRPGWVLVALSFVTLECSSNARDQAHDAAVAAKQGDGGAALGDQNQQTTRDAGGAGSGGGGRVGVGSAGHMAGAGGMSPVETPDENCPGYVQKINAPRCSSDGDCQAGARCLFSQPPAIGGVIIDCRNHPCATGTVCVVRAMSFSCIAPCNAAAAPPCQSGVCAPGERFTDALGCRPLTCAEMPGFDCGPDSKCDPASAKSAADSGCARMQCKTSSDCPCGTCTQGLCYEHPLRFFVQEVGT